MKSPMLESVFNKAAGLHLANLLKEMLQLKSFLVNTAKIFKSIFFYRTPPVAASVDVSRCCLSNKPKNKFDMTQEYFYKK